MNKILLSLLLVSICLFQEETLIQLENGLSLTNLKQLMTMDFNKLTCQTNLMQVGQQLKMWAELYQDEKVIHHEIRLLSKAHKILNQQRFDRLRNTNTLHRAKRILAALRHNTHKKEHTIYQQWRVNEIKQLKHSIQLLQSSTSEDDSKQCCDRIEQLINKYLDQRKHIAKQCGNSDITINIINDAEGKIQVVNRNCQEREPDQLKKEEQNIVTEKKQEQVVDEHHEQNDTVIEEIAEEEEIGEEEVEEEIEIEETIIEETVTTTTSTKVVELTKDDTKEVVEGQIISTQGVGACGEGGRT
ncbi:unnamed protein product [Paramecium octaurelia]|uniref:Uncharacterized protein n=1 Tax=Paramecium octaurelia TaxID=43137 RepID=A0A8S1S0C5_PAROT|nr:unnamed protein product [Paramecium octaurelia]